MQSERLSNLKIHIKSESIIANNQNKNNKSNEKTYVLFNGEIACFMFPMW